MSEILERSKSLCIELEQYISSIDGLDPRLATLLKVGASFPKLVMECERLQGIADFVKIDEVEDPMVIKVNDKIYYSAEAYSEKLDVISKLIDSLKKLSELVQPLLANCNSLRKRAQKAEARVSAIALSEEQKSAICIAIQLMERDISDLGVQTDHSAIHAKQELEVNRDALRGLLAGTVRAWVMTEEDKSIMRNAIACWEDPNWTGGDGFESWETIRKLINMAKEILKEGKT